MYEFLIPLLIGFACNIASASTTAFSRRWGERRGSLVTAVLRNGLGIPVWVVGFWLAASAPAAELFRSGLAMDMVGWILIGSGGVVIGAALYTLRFRALKPSTRDSLAQSGIYSRVRHPIHSGTLLEFVGLFLILPTLTVGLASALGVGWVLVQTRAEEADLLQRLPGYREYMNTVPRFVPRMRLH